MEDRKSSAISIGELAEYAKGEILNCSEQSGELVENLMVGAMCVDPAPLYFNIKTNKAVITRGDRADIQLGALDTPTKCLILTSGIKPIPSVMQRADEVLVPIILVTKDTPATLVDIESGLSQNMAEAPVAADVSETIETAE